MTDNFSIIQQKLIRFIRRYYFNRVIRGFLYAILIAVITLLLVLLAENRLWMGVLARTVLFWGSAALVSGVVIYFIIIPLLKIFQLGNTLSERQAAILIGKHFPEVDDMLLNTLELKALLNKDGENQDLLQASIVQKTEALRPVPFHLAVNLRANVKYLRFVIPAIVVFLLLIFLRPALITEPANRIIHYNESFEKPLPFHFEILNESMETVQNSDFSLQIKVSGELLPDAVYVVLGDQKYRLTNLSVGRFMYQFRNLSANQDFKLQAGEIESEKYTIFVYPSPVLTDFDITANVPDYTGLDDEVWSNLNDISVPQGTSLKWKFYTRDCDSVFIILKDTVILKSPEESNVVSFDRYILRNTGFKVVTGNEYIINPDTLEFHVKSIADRYPEIRVTESRDSLLGKRLFFDGNIRDDYGFSSLRFYYKHIVGDDTTGVTWSEAVNIAENIPQQSFFHSFDLETLMLMPGDKVSYYFELCDNDAVSGVKCVKSSVYRYEAPTLEEIELLAEESEDEIIDKMDRALDESRDIRKEIEELTRKMLENQEVTWEEKDKVKDLLQRQEELQKEMKNLMEENRQMNMQETEFKEFNPELLEKQQQLEELFEELMSEEMKEMFEEMQKLMEEMDKSKMSEMLEEMEMSNEELEEQLDRTLEMFKKLEVEKDLNEYSEKLEKLADEQDKNAENTENADDEALNSAEEKQQELNKKFEELSEDLKEIMEKNEGLDQPFPIEDPTADEEEVKSDQQQSLEQMQQGQKQKSSESQKSAANKMRQMSGDMMNMMAGMQMQQLAEDMDALRQLLENLVKLSFMQEDVINDLSVMRRSDPAYTDLIRTQNTIRTDLEMVKDSLVALGKRQMAVKPYITEKINDLNHHVGETLDFLTEYRISNALKGQQYSMTAINDLALLLSEAMEQMQNQMQSMQSGGQGNSTCPRPGGEGQMDIGNMRQLQEQLSKQLEELKKGMKPGGEMQGGMSEKLARAAAQQSAIRRQMQKLAEEMMEQNGQVSGNMRQMINEMEQNETDIVNKRITQATINRQKDIVTRLLQSERAEQQREKDEQRRSDEAKNQKYSNPEAVLQYNREKEKEVEMLRTIPPALNQFFRLKVNDYFYRVKEE
jgi:hypothetical protein